MSVENAPYHLEILNFPYILPFTNESIQLVSLLGTISSHLIVMKVMFFNEQIENFHEHNYKQRGYASYLV